MALSSDATCVSCGEQLATDEEKAGIHAVCGPPDRPSWPDGRAVEPGDRCRVVVGPAQVAGQVGQVVEVNNDHVAVALEDSRVMTFAMPELQRARGDHA